MDTLNKATPKVSVIMPAYNVEAYIEDSVNSVIRQSLIEIEIICVNDGSRDRTLEILQTIARRDTRVVIIDQENQGQSKARNEGLSLARGEYIYFFDSDDLLDEDALRVLYNHAKRMDAQLVLFDGTAFFDNEELELQFSQKKTLYQRTHEYIGVYKGDELFTAMINNGDYIVSPCLQFFEHRYLRDHNIQFKEGIIHEDNLFSLRAILSCERVCHLGSDLFKRRVRENSTMTSEFSVDHYMGYYTSLVEMFRFIMMSREKIGDHAIIAAKERLVSQYKTAIYQYEMLPSEQQCQPAVDETILDFISGILYTPLPVFAKTVDKHDKAILKQRNEIERLNNKLTEKQKKLIEEREKKARLQNDKARLQNDKTRLQNEKARLQNDKARLLEKKAQLYEKKKQLNIRLIEARDEIEAIKRSKTYLAGRAITFIPRAIKRLLNSLKQ